MFKTKMVIKKRSNETREEYQRRFSASPKQRLRRSLHSKAKNIMARMYPRTFREIYDDLLEQEGLL